MIRLFVAIALPEAQRARIAGLAGGVPGARWVLPENIHLTLRFIGEVEEHLAEEIDTALSAIKSPAFPVRLRGLDLFENARRPRVLYLRADAHPDLMALQERIERTLQRAGLPPEGRRFRPHVTLARFKTRPGRRLGTFLEANGAFDAGGFEAQEFTLFSSFLRQGGAIYRAEADYPLGPPAAALATDGRLDSKED